MKTDLTVITPFYNESENVDDLCNLLDEYAKDKAYKLELIFVSDGSTDDSAEKILGFNFKYTKAKLIILSRNYGSHAAIRAGLSKASSEITMFFSGDLQEPVELIDRGYNKILEGYDVVYVQKRKTKVSKNEDFFSKLFARLVRRYAIKNFPLGGVNNLIFNKKVRDVVNKHQELNSSIFLQIIDMGFKSAIIDCDYFERKKGKSKWTFGKRIKMFIDSFVSFSFAPIRAVSIMGLLLSFAGILYALYILIVKIFDLYPYSAGFPTIVAVILFGFGITNISLGIIAEYLWRTLDSARNRPGFIIDKEIDLN